MLLLIATVLTVTGSIERNNQANTNKISISKIDEPFKKNSQVFSGIEYSTFLGGFMPEWAISADIDENEELWVTGITNSFMFPTKNAYDKSYNILRDVFVTKFSASGEDIKYSSFFGGTEKELASKIKVDKQGNIYVCGLTESNDFPLKNSIQNQNNGKEDVFIFKLDDSGKNIIYSTIIGGNDIDRPFGLEIDDQGSAYITGRTKSKDFPLKNPVDDTHNGTWESFVCKISPQGNKLNFSSYIGGEKDEWGYGIGVDDQKNIFLTGNTSSEDFPLKNAFDSLLENDEAYLVKINSTSYTIEFSTFIGGSKKENAWGLTTDSQGDVYICGRTHSDDFFTKNSIKSKKNGDCDIFVAKFSNEDCSLLYSTIIGGDRIDDANRIVVDDDGCAYITALTTSEDFPVINPFDGTYNGDWDAYAAKISPNGDKLLYCSYLGGKNRDDGYDIVLGSNGSFYVVGWTNSPDFPVKNAYQKRYAGNCDGFITKFSPGQYTPIREVKGGLSLSAIFDSNESPLNWSIQVDGKIILGDGKNGILPSYSYEKIDLGFILGLGKIIITITANDIVKKYSAFVFGPFFLKLEEIN